MGRQPRIMLEINTGQGTVCHLNPQANDVLQFKVIDQERNVFLRQLNIPLWLIFSLDKICKSFLSQELGEEDVETIKRKWYPRKGIHPLDAYLKEKDKNAPNRP